ncbi:Mss4-like [Phaffia rhodozyma]|uniref:Mss4-like n=1 Tax=Phaffia rhodozyma TaxID=264483 RepID=A0A0F7SI66_PHARH|nr:Mss4-like [Phaffia rhodozyma]
MPESEKEWRNSAPYVIDEETGLKPKDFNVHRGTCFCNKVKWGFSIKDALDSKQLHGAPYQWAAIFPKNKILFDKESIDYLQFYNSKTQENRHDMPCKVACSDCHSPIMDEGRNMCLVFPTLVEGIRTDRETAKAFEVKCHIFYDRRVELVHDGKPKWAEAKEDSDLLDDDGNKIQDHQDAPRKKKRDEEEDKKEDKEDKEEKEDKKDKDE